MSSRAALRALREGWQRARGVWWAAFWTAIISTWFYKHVVRADEWGRAHWDWEALELMWAVTAVIAVCLLLGLARRTWVDWHAERRRNAGMED